MRVAHFAPCDRLPGGLLKVGKRLGLKLRPLELLGALKFTSGRASRRWTTGLGGRAASSPGNSGAGSSSSSRPRPLGLLAGPQFQYSAPLISIQNPFRGGYRVRAAWEQRWRWRRRTALAEFVPGQIRPPKLNFGRRNFIISTKQFAGTTKRAFVGGGSSSFVSC